MALSGSGRRAARCGRKRASSAAGCTRQQTCGNELPKSQHAKASGPCRRSGWWKPRPRPRSMPSSRPTQSNIEPAFPTHLCLCPDPEPTNYILSNPDLVYSTHSMHPSRCTLNGSSMLKSERRGITTVNRRWACATEIQPRGRFKTFGTRRDLT